jgi:superfamily II DNA helicase RecQ
MQDTIAQLRGGNGKFKIGVNAARELGTSMVMISPTNALADDTVREANAMPGVQGVRLRAASESPKLFEQLANTSLSDPIFTVFVVGWETCASEPFSQSISAAAKNPECGLVVIGVDEAHLLCSWGAEMRRAGVAAVSHVRDPFFAAAAANGAGGSAPIPIMYVCSASMTEPVRKRLSTFLRLLPGAREVLQQVSRPEMNILTHYVDTPADGLRLIAKKIAE